MSALLVKNINEVGHLKITVRVFVRFKNALKFRDLQKYVKVSDFDSKLSDFLDEGNFIN